MFILSTSSVEIFQTVVLCLLLAMMSFWCFQNNKWISKDWIKKWFSKPDLTVSEYEEFVSQLALSLQWLRKNTIGALIVIEKDQKLNQYSKLGYDVKAKFTPEFLINIFSNKSSAMHDGGVVIRRLNIVSVSAYFPITTDRITTSHGARHRAAIGITEKTDAIAIVVSETNGKVSFAENGTLKEFNWTNLINLSTTLFEMFTFYIK